MTKRQNLVNLYIDPKKIAEQIVATLFSLAELRSLSLSKGEAEVVAPNLMT
jgi:hypothetical protein